jgi:hypothetical protein
VCSSAAKAETLTVSNSAFRLLMSSSGLSLPDTKEDYEGRLHI